MIVITIKIMIIIITEYICTMKSEYTEALGGVMQKQLKLGKFLSVT